MIGLGTERVEIRLNRPHLKNSLSRELIVLFRKALASVADDGRARLLFITGEGDDFCAGVDLNWMKEISQLEAAEIAVDSRQMQQMLSEIHTLPMPVIAIVQGRAFAGGLGIASACDIIVAQRDAKFAITEARLGLVPAVIAPFVTQKISVSAFREMALSGLVANAEKMHQIGLVNYLADNQQQCIEICDQIQYSILRSSPDALAACKQMIRELTGQSLNQGMQSSLDWVVKTRGSSWALEGINAFLEKRKPMWNLV